MYIEEGKIIGYTWKLYYDSTLLTEDDYVYETEEEAISEAEIIRDDRIEQWKSDDAWHDYDSVDDFDIVINEVFE